MIATRQRYGKGIEMRTPIDPRPIGQRTRPTILTTLTPADRVPSVGTQLSADRSADLTSTGRRIDNRTIRDDLDDRADAGDPVALSHGFGTRRPEPLNLWDQSADSLPETWSTPR